MKTIIIGPRRLEDFTTVRKELDIITFEFDGVILVTDLRPGKETSINPTSFPLAEKWMLHRWRRAKDKSKFCKTVYFHAPYHGNKQWTKGLKEQRKEMVKNADAMIIFWDSGNMDIHTEALYKLGKFYDIPIHRVLI